MYVCDGIFHVIRWAEGDGYFHHPTFDGESFSPIRW